MTKAFTILFLAITGFCIGQVKQKPEPDDKNGMTIPAAAKDENSVYSFSEAEKKPEFPGGLEMFYEFIAKNYIIPQNPELKGGRIFVQFVIEKDGAVTDVKVLRGLGFGTGEEAIRVLQRCPNWIPGEAGGKPVKVMYSIPIKIDLPGPEIIETENPATNTLSSDQVTLKETAIQECEPHTVKEVDTKAEFPGGIDKFVDFVVKRFKFPGPVYIDSKIFVTFVIREDGSLTDIKVIRDIGRGTGAEITRVLNLSPKWKPAQINGINVCMRYGLPIILKGSAFANEK